ncbi:MAG: amidase [Rhodobacteraceae bacterium]|nr:amidase [Paracoccaceae bacterium]
MLPPTLSATELARDLSTGRVLAVDVMQATLDRIALWNPKVNAIVGMKDRNALMAEAQAADEGAKIGPLHGLPVAVKDLVNVQGVISTHGSPIFRDFVPEVDDLLARRLRQAGAILIGKTNVPEFGLGSHTFNPVYGPSRNPYNLDVSCGGSSGGAAVALATGMTLLADGSDMMGSLRNPAAWNNVYGLRPTWGRVPSEPTGDMYLHPLSTLGPMARSPQDLALLLDVLSGPDVRVPLTRAAEPISPLKPLDLEELRVGWLGNWGGNYPMEPGVLSTCEAALAVLSDLGAHVETANPNFPSERIWNSWITLRSFAVSAGLKVQQAQRAQLKDTALWELDTGLSLSAPDIQVASEARSDWFRACVQLLETYDVLMLPSAQVWPFALETAWPKSIADCDMDTYHRWMEVVTPVSLLGLPSLAVPAGFGANGLPMGVQIFGRMGEDRRILEIGQAYHQATEWPQKVPPPVPA